MIAMAMMSSTIAIASRNSRAPADTRSPSSASTPTANAMSVAAGIAQPAAPAPPAVTSDEQRDRQHHAADRGDRRQRGGAPVAQLADDQLALDLEPDDEEEHRHQPVVDPVVQVQRPELAMPERLVAVTPAVRPRQRDERADQDGDAAGRLLAQELDQRSDDALIHAPRHRTVMRTGCATLLA